MQTLPCMDTFAVLTGPCADVAFRVASCTGEEAISELFGFTLRVLCRRSDLEVSVDHPEPHPATPGGSTARSTTRPATSSCGNEPLIWAGPR